MELIATHETSFQRWSGGMDRYAIHAYGLFPHLGENDYGETEFVQWLRSKFLQTEFVKHGEYVLAHLVWYPVNPPCGGYGKPGLLEPWGAGNVPPIDALELGLMVTPHGLRIEKSRWPDHVLAEWAARPVVAPV